MIIIAPNSKSGLGKVEEGLKNYSSPKSILSKLGKKPRVAVNLPRFKLECTIPLVPMLKKVVSLYFFKIFHNLTTYCVYSYNVR